MVKPSNCYIRLEKLVLPSIFDTSFSIIHHGVKLSVIQQQFWMKECDILGGGGQIILWPLRVETINLNLPGSIIYALA